MPAANNFNAYASFLLGLPGSMGKAYQFYDPMQTREFQQGYYIRDNWQVTRKLSLNLGLRLEHFPIMNRGEFGIERYDPDTNKVLIGGRGNVPRDAGTDAATLMFAPRVGLAYRVNEKTVVRAGFGITNDPYPLSRPIRSPYPAVIVDEYIQPLNSFVPAGSLATGIPAVKFPDLSSGDHRHTEYRLDQLAAARQVPPRLHRIVQLHHPAGTGRRLRPADRVRRHAFHPPGRDLLRAQRRPDSRRGRQWPSAVREVRRQRQPQLLHSDGEPTL